MKKKVLILGNSKLTVFGFRGELIEKLIQDDYDVTVAFPNGPFGEGKEISNQYGCKFIELEMDRRGTSIFKDLFLLKEYIKIIRKEKPFCVLAFTVKCDIYGGMACRLLRVPFFPNITGLGKGLTSNFFVTSITKFLYKIGIKKSVCVFYQNNNDLSFFTSNKIYKGDSIVLPGSGVNLKKFKFKPIPSMDEFHFVYVARIMKAKGIDEYLSAANYFKNNNKIKFHICGYCEENYEQIIRDLDKKGIVIYHGQVNNVDEIVEKCHCLVLPSYHPEGISNVLLEASAIGRPIITTNNVGCKEVVINNVTGYIIEPKEPSQLIKTIENIINLSKKELEEMGKQGNIFVSEKYDRNIVVNEYMKAIKRVNEYENK